MRNFAILSGFALLLICAAAIPTTAQEARDEAKEVERLQAQIAEKEKKIEELTRALGEAQEMMKKLQVEKSQPEARPEPVPAQEPAPKAVKASGKITHVKMESKSVLMDIGRSAGVKTDDVLTVSRAGRVLGKVKVCIVIDDFLSNADILENADDFLPGDDVVLQTGALGQALPQPPKESAPEKPPLAEATDLQGRLLWIEEKLASISDRLTKLENAVTENSERISALSSAPIRKESVSSAQAEEHLKPKPSPSVIQARLADVEGNTVYIWAGTNQGVKEGDVFAIKRDGNVIARVKIDQVESGTGDMCRGQIMSKTANVDKKTDIAEKE